MPILRSSKDVAKVYTVKKCNANEGSKSSSSSFEFEFELARTFCH